MYAAFDLTLRGIFITPCVMFMRKYPLTLILLGFIATDFAYTGGDTPAPQDSCNEIDLVLSNKQHPNPMKEEYRPSLDYFNSINNLFYAVQEGRIATREVQINGKWVEEKYAEIPVYGWFLKSEGYDLFTVFQRMDYFTVCGGCYVGSCCYPVTYAQERVNFVPLKKWVPWQQVCRELDDPRNGKSVKRKILSQIKSENLYGLLKKKGIPSDAVFLDKYSPYVYRDNHMPDEEWMSMYDANGNPTDGSRRSSTTSRRAPAPQTTADKNLLVPPQRLWIEENPKAVETVPLPPPPATSNNTQPQYVPRNESQMIPTYVPEEEYLPPEPKEEVKQKTPAPEKITPPAAAPKAKKPVASSEPQTKPYPTAKPVPGKPGYVISPFTAEGEDPIYFDVRGLPSGTEAKDSASGKRFIVP